MTEKPKTIREICESGGSLPEGGGSLSESEGGGTRSLLRDLVLVLVALLQALVLFMLNQNELEKKELRVHDSVQAQEIAGMREQINALKDRVNRVEREQEKEHQ